MAVIYCYLERENYKRKLQVLEFHRNSSYYFKINASLF